RRLAVVPGGPLPWRLLDCVPGQAAPRAHLRGDLLRRAPSQPGHRAEVDPAIPAVLTRAGGHGAVSGGLRAARPDDRGRVLVADRRLRRNRRLGPVADLPVVAIGREREVRSGTPRPGLPPRSLVLHLRPALPAVRPRMVVL